MLLCGQVEHVVAAYRAIYSTAGDIDELDFLSYKDYLVIPSLADRLASQPFFILQIGDRGFLVARRTSAVE